ncbi:Integrase catalytic domain-containing protein [Aphis craccivora]|uniref:Integrase catalytic domain-containing protein n=1 Tax=Aphis craccivora TaxID=307492 RepID=A0A6G0YHW6_APHCR|nr:Integrase catalytic domain-containing protein [Aphis craccivora]
MPPKTKKNETAEQARCEVIYERSRKPEQLSASVKRLDNLFSRFKAEQTVIINSLVIVGRSDEYESVDSPVTDTVEAVVNEIYKIVDRVSEATVAIQPVPIRQSFSALPKIDLPSFDGSILNCLTGSALSVIKSIPLSASNYNVAWAALTDRFENKRLLATAHLDKLFTFKPMVQESVPALTAFLNIFKENVSTLKLLEVTTRITLADFMLFFLGSRGVDKTETRSNKSQKSIAPKLAFTAASNVVHKTKGVSSYSSKSNEAKHCTICNRGEHFLYHCSEFKTYSVPRRREYVRTNKLCFSCLSSTHMVDNCKSKYLCGKCQHCYTLLHFPSKSEPTTTTTQERVSIDGGEGGSVNTKFSGMSASGTTVLLGTVIVRVLDARGKYYIVRVLFDSGSQILAITTDCVACIGLSRRKCESEIVGLSQSPVTQRLRLSSSVHTATLAQIEEYRG